MTQLALAFDVTRFTQIERETLVAVRGTVGLVKIGMVPFFTGWHTGTTVGFLMYTTCLTLGIPVLVDLKPHDIPTITEGALQAILEADGVMGATVHASAGMDALERAAGVANKLNKMIFVVTVLTSLDDEECVSIFGADRATKVPEFGRTAINAGARGIVASALDLPHLQEANLMGDGGLEESLIPSIRFAGGGSVDQKNIVTPQKAAALKATWGVVGRPIYNAQDPAQAAREFAEAFANPV